MFDTMSTEHTTGWQSMQHAGAMQATLDAAFGKGHQGTMFFDNHKEQQVFLADDLTLKAQRAHRPSTTRPPTAPRRPASARGRPIL